MQYSMLFVGIDISKLKHDIAIVNEQKKTVHKAFVIKETLDGYQYLVEKLIFLKQTYQVTTFKIGLEATGDYWKNLYYYLKKQPLNIEISVINPVQTNAFAKGELRRAKTDAVCAKDIACFMAEKKPPATQDKLPIFDTIKDIDTQIYALKKQQTMTLNKLRMELCKVAPEVEHAFATLASQQLLGVLAQYPTAQAIDKTPAEQLQNLRYGQHHWRMPRVFIMKIKNLAANSVAHKTGPGAGIVVQTLVKQIIAYQQEIKNLKAQIVKLYHNINEQESLLTTIHGIGKESAIIMESYIGDVNRFPSAKQIVAYFGMNPTINHSGKSIRRASRLEKKGSGIMRHKLFMAVLSIIRHKHGPIYKFYQRLVDDGKPKLVAIGAAMRKLIVIIYYMLKKKEHFKF